MSGPLPLMRLRSAAVGLMLLGVLLLLAGWVAPELWRPALAQQRPLAFVLLGAGALLMWLRARRQEERQNKAALASLTHSSMTPYEFAPVTLPMEELPEPAAAGAPLGASNETAASASAPTAAQSQAAPEPAAPAALSPPWSAGLLHALEWRRFEALCEEIFKQDGYVTKSELNGSDSGADIWLHSRLDLRQAVRIVQCRNWSAVPIGVALVREFLGAMVDAGLKSGALMSCGTFTAEAELLARRHGITLVNGPELLALIGKRAPALQQQLMTVATDGEYGRPTCRRCGLKMVARGAGNAGLTHWVCEGAPDCQGTLEWSAGPA